MVDETVGSAGIEEYPEEDTCVAGTICGKRGTEATDFVGPSTVGLNGVLALFIKRLSYPLINRSDISQIISFSSQECIHNYSELIKCSHKNTEKHK